MLARVFIVAALVVAGCGAVPTHVLTNGGPAAVAEGVLVADGPCLELQSDLGDRWVVIWPLGFRRDDAGVYRGMFRVAGLGDRVRVGGGGYGPGQYDFLSTLLEQPVPVECRDGSFWLATSVEP